MSNADVKYPCKKCKYYSVCGDSKRTEPCQGRQPEQTVKLNTNKATTK